MEPHLASWTSKTSSKLGSVRTRIGLIGVDEYNQFLKQSIAGQQPLRKLPPQQHLWGLYLDEVLVSSLHLTEMRLTAVDSAMIPDLAGIRDMDTSHYQILQWSYAFTLPSHRRQGWSKLLRQASMDWASQLGFNYINSVPLPGAPSLHLLNKLDFTRYTYQDLTYWFLAMSR